MKNAFISAVLLSFLLLGCSSEVVESSTQVDGLPIATATPVEEDEEIKLAADVDKLEHKGYVLRRELVKKKAEDGPDTEIYDAVIERNGKELLRFESPYNPWGNELRLGVTDRLAPGGWQFVVELETYRLGALWVVSIGDELRVLFDSGDYGGFSEWIIYEDLDDDGLLEVSLTTSFECGFENIARIYVPTAGIDFGFDRGIGELVPVNHKGIEKLDLRSREYFDGLAAEGKPPEFQRLMSIVVSFALVGREEAGWKLFDEHYPRYLASLPPVNHNGSDTCCGSARDSVSDARRLLKTCFDSPRFRKLRNEQKPTH